MRHPVFSEIIAMHATDGLADSFCGESLSDQKCVDLLAFLPVCLCFRIIMLLMNTPSARMIEKGISRLGRPINDVQAAIENVGNIEVAKLEKGLTVMATISGGAPMLGFLGTVTGMVRAFYEMANAGSGNIDITLLSGGIYEAMITTVGGLIVGIIAMFAYNYLVMLVDRVVNKMESRTMEFMDLLNEPAQK